MEPDFRAFVERQTEIYERIRGEGACVVFSGTKPDVLHREGYLVGLVHPDSVAEVVYCFSERIGARFPVIVTPQDAVHTTLGVNNAQGLDEQVSHALCEAVRAVPHAPFDIHYPRWLFNETTVLVEGYAGVAFVSLADKLRHVPVPLEPAWGAHMTAVRFREGFSGSDVADFLQLMKEAPIIGRSTPTHVKVGYQRLTPEGYSYDTIEVFALAR